MSIRFTLLFLIAALAAGVAAGYWLPQHFPQWLPGPNAEAPATTPATSSAAAPQAGATPPPRPSTAVEVVTVRREALESRLNAVGTLLSDESVMLRPEIAGRLREIRFNEGQQVEAGELLFRLDDDVAAAELQQARANLALAESKFRRSVQLQQQGFISQQAQDEAANALQVERANVALAQARLERTQIVAPFTGQIGLRNVSTGDYVTAGQDLVTLQAIDELKVDFRIPETYLPRLSVGQALDITVDALPGERWEGTVAAISPLVDVAGRAALLRARLENQERKLRPGMFARVNLVLDTTQAIMVPETALLPRDDQQFVMRVANEQVDEVVVIIGQRQGGRVEVVEGLDAGDQVIVAGLQKVSQGSRVNTTVVNYP